MDNSDGFKIIQLPAARADIKGWMVSWKGKFHGVMISTTPLGSYRMNALVWKRISFLATLPALIRGGWTTSSQKRQLNRLEKQLADNQAKLLSAESKLAEKEQATSEGGE